MLSAVAPGDQAEAWLAHAAELGIQGFFIVSGALVFGSLERSRSLGIYGEKRLRRLYPAYVVIILVPAITSGFVTGWSDVEAIARYLGANLIFLNFLEPNLPGLFSENRFTEVNGALWTLKIEVMFYLALPLIALVMRPFGKAWWVLLVLVYGAAEAWRLLLPAYLDHPLAPELARQLPGQMAFFASGMALWKVWDMANRRAVLFGLIGTAFVAASYVHPILEPLRAAGLAGVIACLAFAPGPAIPAARFGDISYGVYITHFPILQAMLMAGLFAVLPLPAAFALAATGVLFASLVLWHLVEKPALRSDSHYRKADSGS